MAHEIDQTTGRAAVFVTGEPAWHRLGTVIENATTSAEAIGLAGLDWRVEQWPVRAFDPDNNSQEAGIPEFVANVRTDTKTVLGVVGKRYRVFQNREAFDFMDALVGDRLAMYETAGSLHGGKRVWMLARIPKEYRAGSDDLIKPYVLLTNTHDGSQALRMIPTTVRVVCQNTLNLAMREAGINGLTVTHHPKLDSRIAEARTKLGIIAARFDQFDEELHAMLSRELSVNETQGYFKEVAGVDAAHQTDRQKKTREEVYGRMSKLIPSKRNPRRVKPERDAHRRMVASIRAHGLLAPLVVRPNDGNADDFKVIAGNRRLAALRDVYKGSGRSPKVPCVLRSVDDDTADALALAENFVREPIHPADEAESFSRLACDEAKGAEAIAAQFGVSSQYVRQRIKLATLARADQSGVSPERN